MLLKEDYEEEECSRIVITYIFCIFENCYAPVGYIHLMRVL